MGVTLVKFSDTQAGLKEADLLAEHLEGDNNGRRGGAHAKAYRRGDDDKNPALVKVDDKIGERKRIFYGYLATASIQGEGLSSRAEGSLTYLTNARG